MKPLRTVLQRTCVAFAVRFARHNQLAYNKSSVGHTIGTSKGRLFASTTDFIPPVPPSSKGTPVFSDIDFQGISPESQRRNADPSAVYVVSGSSRGIGLQFVKALVDRTKGSIVACCRNPSTATGLNDYIQRLSPSDQARIHKISLDLEKQESIEQATAAIKDKFNRVDLLLNVAGLLGDASTTPGPERSLSKLDRAWVEKTMAVNLIGPIMLSKALAPFMKTKRKEDQTTSIIASLSARVGSISDNELGGWYSYRLSKAALNQATRTMSHELKRQGTWTIALHPGTTDTDLSKPFQKNVADDRLFPVEFTVNQLLEVIDSMNAEHSGGLYDWAGKALPF